jgi:DNA-binding transcriptional MerR regulator
LGDRAHLSIGEVLSLLRAEFPDITISKIRFLESQGLLDPERTPSGYRKFYDEDVERLRWILRQQREHFLPLKVIKGRLSEGDPESTETDSIESIESTGSAGRAGADIGSADADLVGALPAAPTRAVGTSGRRGAEPATLFGDRAGPPSSSASVADSPSQGPATPAAAPAKTDLPGSEMPPAERGRSTSSDRAGSQRSVAAAGATATGSSPASASASVSAGPPTSAPAAAGTARGSGLPAGRTSRSALGEPTGEVNLTAEELAASCRLPVDLVRELERFGLISSRDIGGTAYYGEEAQAVANLAAGFASHGVEARHLRMYKNAAERESGLFEQIVMPLIKQRNPQARQQAAAALDELSRLGGELRETLLRRSLRDAL